MRPVTVLDDHPVRLGAMTHHRIGFEKPPAPPAHMSRNPNSRRAAARRRFSMDHLDPALGTSSSRVGFVPGVAEEFPFAVPAEEVGAPTEVRYDLHVSSHDGDTTGSTAEDLWETGMMPNDGQDIFHQLLRESLAGRGTRKDPSTDSKEWSVEGAGAAPAAGPRGEHRKCRKEGGRCDAG